MCWSCWRRADQLDVIDDALEKLLEQDDSSDEVKG